MKTGIHPDYVESAIVCACGEVIQTRSTKKDYRIEICSKCHPFFTGKQKLVDTAGRVERFNRKYGQFLKGQGSVELPAEQEKAPAETEES